MLRILIAAAMLAALAACEKPPVNRAAGVPLETVENVDLGRYLGRWYEIARLPNGFEANCEGVTADYARREDGLISVTNTCRKGAVDGEIKTAEGRARVVAASTNAKLKVSFFGPFWGDYWIIRLAEDYSVSVVGEPSGRYLWILSRTPTLPAEKVQELTSWLRSIGYDPDALYFTKQPPADE